MGDVCIHLRKLHNSDCLSYGKYKVKISINYEESKESTKKYLIPYLQPIAPFEKFQPENQHE